MEGKGLLLLGFGVSKQKDKNEIEIAVDKRDRRKVFIFGIRKRPLVITGAEALALFRALDGALHFTDPLRIQGNLEFRSYRLRCSHNTKSGRCSEQIRLVE